MEFNDRYEQAQSYHNLGIVAAEQRQWEQAEGYYQKALEIYMEFNDRYEQAKTYHNLGVLAKEQRQWEQARDYFLKALEIFVAYQDSYRLGIVLSSLGLLWRSSGDAELPDSVAEVMGITQEEAMELLRAVEGEEKT